MTTIQQNKLRMFHAIRVVLQDEHETWKTHEAFAEAVGELTAAILDVEKAGRQQIAKDGATNTKEVAMDLLGEVAYDDAHAHVLAGNPRESGSGSAEGGLSSLVSFE